MKHDGWAIKGPDGGWWFPSEKEPLYLVCKYKEDAERDATLHLGKGWKVAGYDCVRVKLTEVKDA
jgi:hypothetical protein